MNAALGDKAAEAAPGDFLSLCKAQLYLVWAYGWLEAYEKVGKAYTAGGLNGVVDHIIEQSEKRSKLPS
jgi:hypothetical protein